MTNQIYAPNFKSLDNLTATNVCQLKIHKPIFSRHMWYHIPNADWPRKSDGRLPTTLPSLPLLLLVFCTLYCALLSEYLEQVIPSFILSHAIENTTNRIETYCILSPVYAQVVFCENFLVMLAASTFFHQK